MKCSAESAVWGGGGGGYIGGPRIILRRQQHGLECFGYHAMCEDTARERWAQNLKAALYPTDKQIPASRLLVNATFGPEEKSRALLSLSGELLARPAASC